MDPISTYPTSTGVIEPELFMSFLKSFGMLAVVLGILVGVLFLMKKFSVFGVPHTDKNMIRMLASFNLAPREKVVLLDVQGEKILIGVTPQQISRLAVIENRDWKPEEIHADESGFSKLLKGAAKKVASGEKSGGTSS